MTRHLAVAAVAALLSSPALAQVDCEGCRDHPAVGRFPGYYLDSVTRNDFNSFSFQMTDDQEEPREGRFWDLNYMLKEGARSPSCLEVVRNYENAFRKSGGKVHWRQGDGCAATLSMPLGKSQRWMKVGLFNDVSWLQLVIVELAQMEQKVDVSAAEMLEALNKSGFVALRGILFETGKDAIKAESEPLLAEVVALLRGNPGLRLSIEGHTDNVGNAKANQTLSQKRAESVRKYLVEKGVDGKRLSARGWGDTKPVADNRTEDGRAQNRRVELVKQ
jgi:outer membrane protein OmpA-like peptidoglycan-associated protein